MQRLFAFDHKIIQPLLASFAWGGGADVGRFATASAEWLFAAAQTSSGSRLLEAIFGSAVEGGVKSRAAAKLEGRYAEVKRSEGKR